MREQLTPAVLMTIGVAVGWLTARAENKGKMWLAVGIIGMWALIMLGLLSWSCWRFINE